MADLHALLEEIAATARARYYPRHPQDPPWVNEVSAFLEGVEPQFRADGLVVYEAVVWFHKPHGKRRRAAPESLGLFAEKWRAELAVKQRIEHPGPLRMALGGDVTARVIR